MTHAHHEVHIHRPTEEVFDFLADGSNNPRWQRLVTQTKPPSGPIEVGSTFYQRARHPLGFTVSADYRVTAYQRPRHLAITATSGGPIRPTITFDLTPIDDNITTLRCTIEYHPHGLGRLATPALALLRPLFAWESSAVEKARNLLEASGPQAA